MGLIEVKVFRFLVVSRILFLVIAAGLMAGTVVPAFSQAKAPGDADAKKEEASVPVSAETSSVTKHEWAAGGRLVHYTATAGNLLIRDDQDKANGSIFYVAYTENGAE